MSKRKNISEKTLQKYYLVAEEGLVNGFNGTRAYQKYYPNCSDAAASVEYNKILKIPKVAEYLKKKQEEAKEKLALSHSDMLRALKIIKDADSTDILDSDVESLKRLPLEIKQILNIKTVLSGDSKKVEVSFMDKSKAYEMINRHIGFYEKDNVIKVKDERSIEDLENEISEYDDLLSE